MAFCGIEFKDEKMEEENVHSLNNICVYSTSRKQMERPRKKEGLLEKDEAGNVIDRRIKIVYSEEKFAYLSYRGISQITAILPKGTKAVGSCISIKARDGRFYALTCAHNVGDLNFRTKRFVNYNKIHAYKARQGANTWRICSLLDDKTVSAHPKYNGHSDSGFDIAVCEIIKDVSKINTNAAYFAASIEIDVQFCSAYPKDLEKGMRVEVAGYPGEKEGQPHTNFGEIVDITETESGGYLLWHNVDCTGGNSGSPIMITDEKWIKKFQDSRKGVKNIKKVIIGVHTGHDPIDGFNYGTLITPSIHSWITTEQVE